jgi:hypothetical protein
MNITGIVNGFRHLSTSSVPREQPHSLVNTIPATDSAESKRLKTAKEACVTVKSLINDAP